jgi:hypothetical protein
MPFDPNQIYNRMPVGPQPLSFAELSQALQHGGEMEQRQKQFDVQQASANEQLDRQLPKEVAVPYNLVDQYLNDPQTTYGLALQDANRIQSKTPRVIQNKDGTFSELIEEGGRTFKRPVVNVPESNFGGKREVQSVDEQPMNYNAKAFRSPVGQQEAMRNAAMLGGRLDEQTGAIILPGHIGMELIKNLQPKIAGDIADMYKTSARPQQAVPYTTQQQERPPPRTPVQKPIDPFAPRIKQKQEVLNKLMNSEFPDRKTKAQISLVQEEMDSLLKEQADWINGINSGGAKQSGRIYKETPEGKETPLMRAAPVINQTFMDLKAKNPKQAEVLEKKVVEYMKTHKVARPIAEGAILKALESKLNKGK